MSGSISNGVVITDKLGNLVFSGGLGKENAIQKQLRNDCWKDTVDERTFSPLKVNGEDIFVMASYAEDHNVFLVGVLGTSPQGK